MDGQSQRVRNGLSPQGAASGPVGATSAGVGKSRPSDHLALYSRSVVDSLSGIQERLNAFYDARDWRQFQSLKDVAISAGIEVAELQELFLWKRGREEERVLTERRADVESELADVLINCLNFARLASIDVAEAIHRKISALEEKYPVGSVSGRVVPHV